MIIIIIIKRIYEQIKLRPSRIKIVYILLINRNLQLVTTTLNFIQITPCLKSALKRLVSDLKAKPRVPVVCNCLLNEKTYFTGLAYHALVSFQNEKTYDIFKVACFFTRRRSIQWKVTVNKNYIKVEIKQIPFNLQLL